MPTIIHPKLSVLTILAIAPFLVAAPGLGAAQQMQHYAVPAEKWQYRDLLKTIEVKSPHENPGQVKPAEATPLKNQPLKTTDKRELPTVDWRSIGWRMSSEQLAANNRRITPTTSSERRDHSNTEFGTALLKERYVVQNIQYTAFYWFRENELVAIVMKPSEPGHWSKVNVGLEQIHGTPIDDRSTTTFIGAMRCVVIDKIWKSELDGNLIKFRAQDCNHNEHLNFYSVRYEPQSTTSTAAPVVPFGIGQAGVRDTHLGHIAEKVGSDP